MFKRIFYHSLIAGILATAAALIYSRIYYFATEADYSKIINIGSMTGLNMLVCLVAAFINWGLLSWLKKKGEIVFNLLFSIVSFACVAIPISATLPMDIKNPELFPGLAVPMVFFPAMAWYTISPIFRSKVL